MKGYEVQVEWEFQGKGKTVTKKWYPARIIEVNTQNTFAHFIEYEADGWQEWVDLYTDVCKSQKFDPRRMRWPRPAASVIPPSAYSTTALPAAFPKPAAAKAAKAKTPAKSAPKTPKVHKNTFVSSKESPAKEAPAKQTPAKADSAPATAAGSAKKAKAAGRAKAAGGAKATRSAAEATTPRALRSEGGTTLFEMADDQSGLRKLEKTPSKVVKKAATTPASASKSTPKSTPKASASAKKGTKRKASPQSPQEEEDDVYIVEKVLGTKKKGKKTLYEVKWQGFPGENTWEPADNLKNCECLVEFLEAQKPAEKTPVKTPGKKARETSPAHTHNYFAVLSPPDAARLTPDAA